MGYSDLVLAALFRHRTRTFLTIASIAITFLLFGTLDTVRVAFSSGARGASAGRLIVSSRASMVQSLPESLGSRIDGVAGVKSVAYANWFGGAYQNSRNQIFALAVSTNYLDVNPELRVTRNGRMAWSKTRTGALVSAALAKRFGWKVGDEVPIISTIWPSKSSGNNVWTFKISGLIHTKSGEQANDGQLLLFHWKYFDKNNAYTSGQVHWYVVDIADPTQASSIGRAIDAISSNSDHETRTQVEQAYRTSFANRLINIGFVVPAIIGSVFFTLLLLTGNTMMHTVRERTAEIAVLKTIGFTDTRILSLVITESILLILAGGLPGLVLAAAAMPIITWLTDGAIPANFVAMQTCISAVALMVTTGLIVGIVPGVYAMRLDIVDALGER